MTPLKTLTAGIGAALLTSSMLTGFAAAAQKPVINPKMQVVAPKPVMIKPVRPTIARPHIKVRVNRDLPEKKVDQDDGEAEALPRSVSQPNGKKGIAAMLPPQRLPKPRPDFEDALKDIRDAIGADGVGGADPDELQVATIPHGSDGPLGDFGLPNPDDEAGQAQDDSQGTGSFANAPGGDSMWNDPRGAIDNDILNPAGDNSHSKDAPSVFPGARVDTGSLLDGLASDGDEPDAEGDSPNVTHHTEGDVTVTKRAYSDGHVVITKSETINRQSDGEPIGVASTGFSTYPNGYLRMDFNQVDNFSTGESHRDQRRHGPITTEWKSNPDYVEGGGYIPVNCGSVGCNESRKGKPGLRLSDGMVRALTDPEHSAAGPRTGADPIVSQHDLLSQYDPEFAGGGEPTPIDKPRIQSD